MRILLCSYLFAPSVGGLETASAILAEQYTRLGATVTVVTSSPGPPSSAAYEILRRPSAKKIRMLGAKIDIVHSDHISVRTIAPLLFTRIPIVITHHGWCWRANQKKGWEDYVKLGIFSVRCQNVAISKAIADRLPMKSAIIGEPFDPSEFSTPADTVRDKDIVFIGRVVHDKGCDVLLRALAILRDKGMRPSLSVIGDGNAMADLKRLTAELGLSDQVVFRGTMLGGRGRELARHKVLVVPSRYPEPFGIVALEGISAGCAVLVSRSGGLPEAVGPCGMVFPNQDAAALATLLTQALASPSLREQLLVDRSGHLKKFRPENVAECYWRVFASALRNGKTFLTQTGGREPSTK
jgi:glycogen synthase